MLSVSEARERILQVFHPTEAEEVPLGAAVRRVLAEDIHAPIDLPPFDNSSVDGFALTAADLQQPSPLHLKVSADIPAGGSPSLHLQAGESARVMTGAPIPPGAAAVVMVEDTDFNYRQAGSTAPATVTVHKIPSSGENIRPHGMDLHQGDKVLSQGTRLRAQELGLLAMLGVARVKVHRLPRLALLSSGDELLPVEAPLTPGKIHDSNTYILSALVEGTDAELIPLGIAADTEADVRSRMEQASDSKADLILSSAGVSVGAFDFIKSVVESDGGLDFWKVDMRPGKPFAFGRYKGIPFFGLPGNPVSAFMGFQLFVRPALEKLAGLDPRLPLRQRARLLDPVESDGRESYLRGIVSENNGQLTARLTGHQGSGNIFSLVQANALLIIPSGVKSLPANSDIEIWLIQ
jgi:molybdopterin molybdotransferase